MTELGTRDAGGGAPEPRPTAASVIAELWSEREQTVAPPPTTPPPSDRPRGGDGGKRGLIVAVVAAALALGAGVGIFIAGAGFGKPSKSSFVAKAEGVCRLANDVITLMPKPTSYPELRTATDTLVTATSTELESLRKLTLPAGAAGQQAGALFAAIDDTNLAGRQLRDAAGHMDDKATATATERVRTAAASASEQAKALGLPTCAAAAQPGFDSVVTAGTGLVKTAFVAKADTLCRAGARAVELLGPPGSSSRDLGRWLGQAVPIFDKVLIDLRALAVPGSDAATLADALSGQEKTNAKLRELRDAALANDRSRFLAAEQEYVVLSTAVDAKLDAYGLTSCGSNFGMR